MAADLPCDGDGVCMVCKAKPSDNDKLICNTCITPWHASCLSTPLQTLADAVIWNCPDCTGTTPVATAAGGGSVLVAAIREIEMDGSLSDRQKAKRRQELIGGSGGSEDVGKRNGVMDCMKCSFCMQLPERPVTTPCGHNFCLKCFQKWIGQGKRTCSNCRADIPAKMASQPRINSAVVIAIQLAKMSKDTITGGLPKVYHHVRNQDRPDKCYTTERAKKAGKANACSGKIFVTVPPDHFGPILAENDPERNQGVLVGETWEDRMECRQWGAHLPHVAGTAGQSDYGAQSVALSGGYEDDEDHGEWFLYTGSGGKDLSGNKRTNKIQSFDQKFLRYNEALRKSCRQGYPVRVVRSHKEKLSPYAPETGVRYDGIYRIEKCWRKRGIQGYKVCRYLFVRCDNAPAPWTSDEHGDKPRPLPVINELKDATDITERKGDASWDYDEENDCWMWKRPPPASRKQMDDSGKLLNKGGKRQLTIPEKLLQEFGCLICKKVLSEPLTTPCAHNFCKACFECAFSSTSFIRQTSCEEWRPLRARKNEMRCPACLYDVSEFLQNPQVNRELMSIIVSLQQKINKVEGEESSEEIDITETKGVASPDYDEEKDCWMSKKPPPATASRKQMDKSGKMLNKGGKHQLTLQEKLLQEFGCLICKKVISEPLTTPCSHNFCKACLEGAFAGKSFIRQTSCEEWRPLRARKNVMKCPTCSYDVSNFLRKPQINREMMNIIESLQQKIKKEESEESSEEIDITKRKGVASGDNDEEKYCCIWKKPPPASRKQICKRGKMLNRGGKRQLTIQEKLLKKFGCLICKKVISEPLTTPCAHNFCKACLEGAFSGKSFIRQTSCEEWRPLRARKNVMKCPACSYNVSIFLQNPQVNRKLMSTIKSLQQKIKKEEGEEESSEEIDTTDEDDDELEVDEEEGVDKYVVAKRHKVTSEDDVEKINEKDANCKDSPAKTTATTTKELTNKRKRACDDAVKAADVKPTEVKRKYKRNKAN